jgi:hypothetical protein
VAACVAGCKGALAWRCPRSRSAGCLKGVARRGRGNVCNGGWNDCSGCIQPGFQPDRVEAKLHNDCVEPGAASTSEHGVTGAETSNGNVCKRPIRVCAQKVVALLVTMCGTHMGAGRNEPVVPETFEMNV